MCQINIPIFEIITKPLIRIEESSFSQISEMNRRIAGTRAAGCDGCNSLSMNIPFEFRVQKRDNALHWMCRMKINQFNVV
jgi:hypothetical protein